MTIKYKDGEYIVLWFEDHPGWEPFKGWHSAEHCQGKLIAEHGKEDAKRVTRVEHKYAFWGVGVDAMGERSQMFYDRDDPGRGRFKVTLAYVDGYHSDVAK
ncbi:hypothetical protein [Pontibacterium sp.]|uniref:hypothetical protein n=1 Tax=Pontibacterium sp. TaxID=2036026 RepID=UPI003569DAB0